MAAKKYYAVKAGRKTGIYETWDECKEQVHGYPTAEYKSFKALDDAYDYMGYTQRGEQLSLFDVKDDTLSDTETGSESDTVLESNDKMIAYVDGSYNNLTKEFSYGLIAFYNGETIRKCEAYDDETLAGMRNVAGEIKGAEAAMKLALEKKCNNLHIYHDYEGIAKWPLGEWKANKQGTIAYRDFYKSITPEVAVTFHKVTGHSGDVYNDEADRLAKSALGLD